jgi:hypothetical protein
MKVILCALIFEASVLAVAFRKEKSMFDSETGFAAHCKSATTIFTRCIPRCGEIPYPRDLNISNGTSSLGTSQRLINKRMLLNLIWGLKMRGSSD